MSLNWSLNSRGVSLVAALVSVAIVSVMILTVINLIGISADVLNTFNNSLRAMDAAQEVRFALTDANVCTLNLRGINMNTATNSSPAKVVDELRYPEGGHLSSRPVVNIDNEDGEPLAVEGVYVRQSTSAHLGYVDVALKKKDAPASEGPAYVRSVPMWVQTDAAGGIRCCSTLNMSACPLP
jgi:competence protein ComGC